MPHILHILLTVGAFLTGWLLVWTAIAFPLFRKFQWRPFVPVSTEQKLVLLLPLYLLAPVMVYLANRVLEQSWADLGITLGLQFWSNWLYGLAIAVAGLMVTCWLKARFGLTSKPLPSEPQPPGQGPVQSVLAVLGLFALGVWIGGTEELIFRGWMQTQLEMAFPLWGALFLSSAVFAVAHLVWDGTSGLRQQPGLWVLGSILVIARWLDGGSLAIPWGLHAGWVWGLACLDTFWQLQPAPDQPLWLTGQPGQPLTSILDFVLMVATVGLIEWLHHPMV